MIKNLLFFLSLVVFKLAVGQQQVSYNQYNFLPTVYNPSFVGSHSGVDVGVLRNQKWQNFNEGFIANNLVVSSKLFDNHGIGINLYSDYAGITSKLRAQLQYAYQLKVGADGELAVGVGAGVVDNRIDFSDALVADIGDPFLIASGQDRRTTLDLSLGARFTYKELNIGIAVPQSLGLRLNYTENTSGNYTLERDFVGTVGYSYLVSDKLDLRINPEVLLLYTPGSPFNYNITLIADIKKYGWLGAAYKANYAIGAMAGINIIKNLKVGFAYDVQIGQLATFSNTPNIEIMLKYNFKGGGEEPDYSAYEAKIDSLSETIVMNEEAAAIKIKDLRNENEVLEDSLAKWPKETQTVREEPSNQNEKIETSIVSEKKDTSISEIEEPKQEEYRTNTNDHFIELNNTDSKNGYYVIAGAFAEKDNAYKVVGKVKEKFPSARIIMNKRNNLFYVMLYYSDEKGEGLAYQSYKAKIGLVEETWILFYNRQ